MNKRAARILILFLVFAASVGVFTHLMSHETTENATDLDAASLPVLYMKTADTTVNRMYGYRQEMNGVTTRENLTPLPMDRSLTLEIDAKGQKIKNVTYTVESTDGGALIENSVLKSFDEDGSYLKADFQLETAILMNQEYTLKLEVAYGNGQSAWYYTRIVQRNGVEVGDYLAYTQMFAQTCLDKTQAEALVPQLEPDETGDNSSFLNVNIHSSLDQISWGSLAPTIIQQPVQQIKEANETTTSITQEYMISAQDENGQTEYYTVSEFYRMRESDGEIILLDFERSAQQIFDPELGVLTKSGINLGVTGEDTKYVTNTAGDIVAFVVNGDLWCYNRSANKTIRVFSFRENGSMDDREQHGEHDVNIVRVDDAGDVTFVVYGYMNRGNHEGEVGAAVYYYRAERNVATEEIFVPADISYEMLKKQLDRLSYVNKQREMYLYLNENLCKVDIETGTTTVVRESIPVGVIQAVRMGIERLETVFRADGGVAKRREVEQIKQYIRENYSDSGMGVDQLAREVGMTPNYLSSIFKKNTGENLSRYLKSFRMERAREMLENTNEKIGIICEKCGFVNVSYFCQSFREFFGISPQKYRDQGE